MPRWTLEQLIAYEQKRGLKPEQPSSPMPAPKPAKRIRQSSAPKLNKLETEYRAVLVAQHVYNLRDHAIILTIGNGVRYTPDFTGWTVDNLDNLNCWEVKGPHAWEDAMVKLKVAAGIYTDFIFWLVWKQHGHWQTQRVLP